MSSYIGRSEADRNFNVTAINVAVDDYNITGINLPNVDLERRHF